MACEIVYNNFEVSLVVFMPNITTNHAITYTNLFPVVSGQLHLGEKKKSIHTSEKALFLRLCYGERPYSKHPHIRRNGLRTSG